MHFLLHFYLSIFFLCLNKNETKPSLLTLLVWGDEWILPLDQDHGGQTDPCMLFLWSAWLTGMFCILLNSQHHTSSKFMMPRTFEVSLRVHLFSYAVSLNEYFLLWACVGELHIQAIKVLLVFGVCVCVYLYIISLDLAHPSYNHLSFSLALFILFRRRPSLYCLGCIWMCVSSVCVSIYDDIWIQRDLRNVVTEGRELMLPSPETDC